MVENDANGIVTSTQEDKCSNGQLDYVQLYGDENGCDILLTFHNLLHVKLDQYKDYYTSANEEGGNTQPDK
jgi:hypothetical protein